MNSTRPTQIGAKPQSARRLLVELQLAAPFWRYQQLFANDAYAFLLDSAKAAGPLGQYSFLGGDPSLIYRAKRVLQPDGPARARVEVERRAPFSPAPQSRPEIETREADLFADLRAELARFRVDVPAENEIPFPLQSGAVGYFGYEAGHFVEELPDLGDDDLGLPDVYLMFCDVLLAHCHGSGKSFLSVTGRGADESAACEQAELRQKAMLSRIDRCSAALQGELADAALAGRDHRSAPPKPYALNEQFDLATYCRLVDVCRQHILAGDVFEVCLTHRLDAPLAGSAWDLYQVLREINPAPFASYLRFPEATIVSSSPERFVRLDKRRVAESRPIKGTRPRGRTAVEDQALREELAHSAKDRAENLMIVDLVRNDLGRVCRCGTVTVPELMVVEDYATVFQLVSTIRGTLEDQHDALDLLQAAFPGGSMTGAPKIEAQKIIDRLEPVKRGIYSGGIGYIDFAGTMDLSIAIRTFVVVTGHCYFSVGGAVVADSVPQLEYRETLDKAQALLAALARVQVADVGLKAAAES